MRKIGSIAGIYGLAVLFALPVLAQDAPPGKTEIPLGKGPTSAPAEPKEAEDSLVGELPPAKTAKVDGGKVRTIDVSGISIKNDSVNFPSDYSGKLVLIHVWGTWCPHCKKEIVQWQRAWEKFHDQPFDMIGIITDSNHNQMTLADSNKALEERGITWTQIYDDGPQLAANLEVKSLPTVLLCDGDTGEVLFRGDELRGKKLIPLLRTLIAQKAALVREKAQKSPASRPVKSDVEQKPKP